MLDFSKKKIRFILAAMFDDKIIKLFEIFRTVYKLINMYVNIVLNQTQLNFFSKKNDITFAQPHRCKTEGEKVCNSRTMPSDINDVIYGLKRKNLIVGVVFLVAFDEQTGGE